MHMQRRKAKIPMENTDTKSSLGSHNKRLRALLLQTEYDIHAAQSQEDLIAIIERIKAFNGPVAFQHNWVKRLTITLATFALIIIISSISTFGTLHQGALILLIVLGIFEILLIIPVWQKKSNIRSLAKLLYQRDLMFDNNLREVSAGITQLETRLLSNFVEFRRGNYSREVMTAWKGNYSGTTHSFSYHFYHFHYVDEHTQTYTDNKGKNHTRTYYRNYDRYGICLPFNFVSNVLITGDAFPTHRGSSFKPASNRFNRSFQVSADTELTAARFLKPAIVLACESIADDFKKLNLEFNSDAGLCMSFENSMVISREQKYDFSSPEAFIAEIRERNELPELAKALEFIHTLMIHSDSNFKKETE